MSINYNNFKQTTIRGPFRNEDYEDGSIKASAFIANDLSISGQLYTNNINTINLNSYNVSSLINSLSGPIYNQNLYSISLSSRINNNFNNQNLYTLSLSSRINNYVISNNLYTLSLSSRINNYVISNNLYTLSLSSTINDNYNIIQSNINYIATNYVPNLELLNYAKLYTNPLYLLDITGNLNGTTIYENGTLLSSKYLGISAAAAVSNRAVNVAFTSDNTSTALCVAMTAASASTNSAALRIDSNLRFNCSTNTLTTTTFLGNLTGNCSGSSGSCTGNANTSTVANTITVTADNTSTSLFIPLITGASPTEIKVDQGLSFNCVTNTLTTTTFNGNVVGNVNGNVNGNIVGNGNLDYTIHPSNSSNVSIGNSNGDGLINIYGEQIQLAGQLVTRRDIVMQSEAYCPFNIRTFFSTTTLNSPFSKYIICNFSSAGFIYMPYPEFAHFGMEIIVRNVGSAAALISNSTGNNIFLNLSNSLVNQLSGLVAISMVCIIAPSGVGYVWAQI